MQEDFCVLLSVTRKLPPQAFAAAPSAPQCASGGHGGAASCAPRGHGAVLPAGPAASSAPPSAPYSPAAAAGSPASASTRLAHSGSSCGKTAYSRTGSLRQNSEDQYLEKGVWPLSFPLKVRGIWPVFFSPSERVVVSVSVKGCQTQ